jgi:hypothetical protein
VSVEAVGRRSVGTDVAPSRRMKNKERDDAVIVPLSDETDAERKRIRRSNERDQQLEREGKPSAHNEGYDEVVDRGPSAADGAPGRQRAQGAAADTDGNTDLSSAANTGDETPGGDNPTPDQSGVDEIGRAVGLEYHDDEPLRAADKIDARDRQRWNRE